MLGVKPSDLYTTANELRSRIQSLKKDLDEGNYYNGLEATFMRGQIKEAE